MTKEQDPRAAYRGLEEDGLNPGVWGCTQQGRGPNIILKRDLATPNFFGMCVVTDGPLLCTSASLYLYKGVGLC